MQALHPTPFLTFFPFPSPPHFPFFHGLFPATLKEGIVDKAAARQNGDTAARYNRHVEGLETTAGPFLLLVSHSCGR